MNLGSLRITLPDGQTHDYVVEQPIIGVGRAEGNELVIPDPSLSLRHARLTFDAGQLLVEDLGSDNGTFIGTQRAEPNTPSLVPETDVLRLGDVEIRYTAPTLLGAARSFAEPAEPATVVAAGAVPPAGPPLKATLIAPPPPVAPGSTTTASLLIQNRGPVVDELVLRVSDVPVEWVRLSKDRVPLLPGAQEQITVSFQPPRRAEVVAAEHRFTLTIFSREHRTGVNVDGVLRVLPYEGLALSLEPARSARDFQVVALNQANVPATLTLAGSDEANSLRYHFAQPTVTLAPGQTASIGLSVTPRAAPRIGSREVRAFTVTAEAAGSGSAASAAGQLILRPAVPIWLVPLTVILGLCLCITSAFAYVSLCPAIWPTAPFCPAGAPPVINVFTATPSEIDPGDTVVLAWDVSNADRVELVLPTTEAMEASGLRAFNLTESTTFLLRASNLAGSVERTVDVTVRGLGPLIQSFTANPGVITAGQTNSITLSWSVIGVETVTIEGVPGQTFPATGSVEVPAPSANTTYTLVAANETGSVRQTATVVISAAECSVTNVPAPERLNLRAGPAGGYPAVTQLDNGTRVDPLSRTPAGDWVRVRAAGREGWVPVGFITCVGVDLIAYPTVDPALIPTLIPTETLTPVPSTDTPVPTPTPTFTASPTPTDTPTPTPTPVFTNAGSITYRVQRDGRTTIYLQNAAGAPIPLVFDKDDAEVLDYTPNNGGRYAIWVLEGGQQRVLIISRNGELIGSPIIGGWQTITDADWSYDGQRLVVEAVTGGATNYHFYDANGGPLGQPALP